MSTHTFRNKITLCINNLRRFSKIFIARIVCAHYICGVTTSRTERPKKQNKPKTRKMKTIQIEANKSLGDSVTNNDILRAAGVKRIHSGWYTVQHTGVSLDRSTVVSAKRNAKGEIK